MNKPDLNAKTIKARSELFDFLYSYAPKKPDLSKAVIKNVIKYVNGKKIATLIIEEEK